MNSTLKKILLVATFAVVAYLVHLAGESVLAGSPLAALGIVSAVLIIVLSYIGLAKRFET